MEKAIKSGLAVAVILFVLGIFGLIVFRIGWLNYVENYELGYQFDSRSGELTVLHHTGYVMTPPIVVSVHTVDLRPMQVCINANSRVLNCKLVQFNPKGLETFVSWHGRNNYAHGSQGTTGNLNDILTSYAFDGSGKEYPFLTVLRELKTDGGDIAVKTATGASTVNPAGP